jgi:hypothetical protein
MTDRPDQDPSAFDIAVQVVAHQPGMAERILAVHRRLPDGLCCGCLTSLTEWPCTVASIALQAQRSSNHH